MTHERRNGRTRRHDICFVRYLVASARIYDVLPSRYNVDRVHHSDIKAIAEKPSTRVLMKDIARRWGVPLDSSSGPRRRSAGICSGVPRAKFVIAVCRFAASSGLLFVTILFCLPCRAPAAPVVWTGPTISFSKVGSADPLLAANQDRLTDNVWITRGGAAAGGIYNIAPGMETEYDQVTFISPADTRWATDIVPGNTGKVISAAIGKTRTWLLRPGRQPMAVRVRHCLATLRPITPSCICSPTTSIWT